MEAFGQSYQKVSRETFWYDWRKKPSQDLRHRLHFNLVRSPLRMSYRKSGQLEPRQLPKVHSRLVPDLAIHLTAGIIGEAGSNQTRSVLVPKAETKCAGWLRFRISALWLGDKGFDTPFIGMVFAKTSGGLDSLRIISGSAMSNGRRSSRIFRWSPPDRSARTVAASSAGSSIGCARPHFCGMI